MAIRLASAAIVAAAVLAAPVSAQETYATLDEAQAMAEAAVAFIESEGTEVAFDAFTNSDDWKDRDLYVFVIGSDGINLAHGSDPDLVGQDLSDLADVNGFLFVQAFLEVEDTGWVDYVWPNPLTDLEEPKRSYIIRVDDFIVGVGAYLGAG